MTDEQVRRARLAAGPFVRDAVELLFAGRQRIEGEAWLESQYARLLTQVRFYDLLALRAAERQMDDETRARAERTMRHLRERYGLEVHSDAAA